MTPERILTRWGTATNPGRVRSNNEDVVFAQFPAFVIADGMGGQAGGEVASSLAAAQFLHFGGAQQVSAEEVLRAIDRANRAVVEAADSTDGLHGMGTTLVGMVLVEVDGARRWFAFNVGDSRLYRYADGVLAQVSRDHSEVQMLIDQGVIEPEAARTHPHRHVITRAVGGAPDVEADYWLLEPQVGDRFVLCSDGLTDELEDAAIATVLAEEEDVVAAATRLVDLAIAAGGHDNVTVVVLQVLEAG